MPLVPESLQQNLLNLRNIPQPDRLSAGHSFVNAYDQYALQATASGAPLTYTGTEKERLFGALLPVFVSPVGEPASFAAALAAGITAYWTGALFGIGVAAPPAGATALQAALLPILANQYNTTESWAAQTAALLDTCTRTVLVTFPGSPPLVVPVV